MRLNAASRPVVLSALCALGTGPSSRHEHELQGTVKLTSLKPALPGGTARRTLTIAEGSIGRIPAGEGRYVSFTIDKSSRERLRSFNKTEALWQSYGADGSVPYINVPQTITIRSHKDR